MPNPYKYTNEELDDLVDQWHNDNYMVYSLKEFIIYETKFSDEEYEIWVRSGKVPRTHG